MAITLVAIFFPSWNIFLINLVLVKSPRVFIDRTPLESSFFFPSTSKEPERERERKNQNTFYVFQRLLQHTLELGTYIRDEYYILSASDHKTKNNYPSQYIYYIFGTIFSSDSPPNIHHTDITNKSVSYFWFTLSTKCVNVLPHVLRFEKYFTLVANMFTLAFYFDARVLNFFYTRLFCIPHHTYYSGCHPMW